MAYYKQPDWVTVAHASYSSSEQSTKKLFLSTWPWRAGRQVVVVVAVAGAAASSSDSDSVQCDSLGRIALQCAISNARVSVVGAVCAELGHTLKREADLSRNAAAEAEKKLAFRRPKSVNRSILEKFRIVAECEGQTPISTKNSASNTIPYYHDARFQRHDYPHPHAPRMPRRTPTPAAAGNLWRGHGRGRCSRFRSRGRDEARERWACQPANYVACVCVCVCVCVCALVCARARVCIDRE